MSNEKDKKKDPPEDNVVDLWGFRIKRDMKKRDEEIRKRDRSSGDDKKRTVSDKIKKALEKYGSFKGNVHKKKKEEEEK